MKFASIIINHYAMNGFRSETLRKCLDSLKDKVKYPYELIVIDNGGNEEDSEYLRKNKDINIYIRNATNLSFGIGRNQGIALSHGEYVVIMDNDVLSIEDWLTESVTVLDEHKEMKIYATPFRYPTHGFKKYHKGEIVYSGGVCKLNMRAGSNCFIIRRKDLMEIGLFEPHRIAGSIWTNNAVRAGYLAACLQGELAFDLGLRKGYNLREASALKINIQNAGELYFNRDEFKERNPDKDYYESI